MPKLDKELLVNLEYSLTKELLRSNRAGAYASSTISNCNTRKYHGAFVCPLEDNRKYVLLSDLDATVIQKGKEFRLGIHQYDKDTFFPHGHRYMTNFTPKPIPTKAYTVGGVKLKVERVLVEEDDTMLERYTFEDLHSPTLLRLTPFTTFRYIHSLSKENMDVNRQTEEIPNGIKISMYPGMPSLHMQTSIKSKFIHVPDWNKNVYYREEEARGYEAREDLFTYGYFEIKVKKGDVIIFSASLKEKTPAGLRRKFSSEIKKRIPRNNFEHNLMNSARQLLYIHKNKTEIIPGFHWYEKDLRASLQSLLGLTLGNRQKLFPEIFNPLLTQIASAPAGSLPVDIPLAAVRVLQDFEEIYSSNNSNESKKLWQTYHKPLLEIIQKVKSGEYKSYLHENGLLYVPEQDATASWMNEEIEGSAVTPRYGFIVEHNALWYNTLMYLSGWAQKHKSETLNKELEGLPEKVREIFPQTFLNRSGKGLFDYVTPTFQNTQIRPNQIFAVSLRYSPLSATQKKEVLTLIENHLLTSRGLRTLSPDDPNYIGKFRGNENERKTARHNGTVHPHMILEYGFARINLHKESGLKHLKNIYENFKNEINNRGLGTLSELFDGDPPHTGNGAISYAPSVAALLELYELITEYKDK